MSEKRNARKAKKSAPSATAAAPGSPMDVGLLAQIVELMSAHDLNTVDVRDGARRVILKRGDAGLAYPMAAATPGRAPLTPPPPSDMAAGHATSASGPGAGASHASAPDDSSGLLRITSPMVGTFYASPKPGEKPFVSVGSTVADDTDVCLIEAMKNFMNIKAECRGTIVRIVAQDGQPVEFGSVLFLVKP